MSLLDEMGGSLEDWVDDPDQLREDYIEDNNIDEQGRTELRIPTRSFRRLVIFGFSLYNTAGGFYDSQI